MATFLRRLSVSLYVSGYLMLAFCHRDQPLCAGYLLVIGGLILHQSARPRQEG
jgi:hypothetical protein